MGREFEALMTQQCQVLSLALPLTYEVVKDHSLSLKEVRSNSYVRCTSPVCLVSVKVRYVEENGNVKMGIKIMTTKTGRHWSLELSAHNLSLHKKQSVLLSKQLPFNCLEIVETESSVYHTLCCGNCKVKFVYFRCKLASSKYSRGTSCAFIFWIPIKSVLRDSTKF